MLTPASTPAEITRGRAALPSTIKTADGNALAATLATISATRTAAASPIGTLEKVR